ncbi:MAG: hypothetical protein ACO3K7_02705 [Candidatus Marinamargulisbacteria bacterium]
MVSKINTNQSVDVIDGDALIGQVIENKNPLVDGYLDQLNDLPESHNIDRVIQLKKMIDGGQYDFDQHLDQVADILISDTVDASQINPL